ncbi:MAG: hypothetical protein ABW065_03910 [Solirubrobacterales bacterium]
MYIVPLLAIIVLCLAVGFWSPIFAVGIAAVFFVLFLGYVGFSRRADEKISPPSGTVQRDPEEVEHGIWGER